MPVRTTEFAPALPSGSSQATTRPASSAPASGYGPPTTATRLGKQAAFPARTRARQLDGTLRCPAGQKLIPHEHRRETDGSLRVVYAASIRSCRPCPLREQCQWQGSVLLHPLVVGDAPLHRPGLESSSPPTRLYPAPARSVHRDPGWASHFCEPGYRVCITFPRRACPFSALLDRATGSQCTSRDFWAGDDPTVRRPRPCCDLARIEHRLNICVFGNARVGPTGSHSRLRELSYQIYPSLAGPSRASRPGRRAVRERGSVGPHVRGP